MFYGSFYGSFYGNHYGQLAPTHDDGSKYQCEQACNRNWQGRQGKPGQMQKSRRQEADKDTVAPAGYHG